MAKGFNVIVYIRSSLISEDVRVQKYMNFLDVSYGVIQWDRSGRPGEVAKEQTFATFTKETTFGGGFKNIFKFLHWNLFLLKHLFRNRNKYKVIQICDLDSYLGCFIFHFFGKKIIFDCYDFFAGSKINNANKFIKKTIYFIEMHILKKVDLLILPMKFRKEHLNFSPKNYFICENVPLIPSHIKLSKKSNSERLRIAYTGTLERNSRGLEWIPQIASNLPHIDFHIAGGGGLISFFREAEKKHSNIFFHGKLSHEESLELQNQSDLIYAIYESHLENNILAAPNKYYESLAGGTPLIVNETIRIASQIKNTRTGFVTEENTDSIICLLKTIDHALILETSRRARSYWNENFSSYLPQKYKCEYQRELHALF